MSSLIKFLNSLVYHLSFDSYSFLFLVFCVYFFIAFIISGYKRGINNSGNIWGTIKSYLGLNKINSSSGVVSGSEVKNNISIVKSQLPIDTLDNVNRNYIKYKNIIKKNYIGFAKANITYLYLSPVNVEYTVFINEIFNMKYFEKDKAYAFLVKIRREDESYKMAGSHSIWVSNDLSDICLKELYEKILNKINDFIEDYKDEGADLIQIMFILINPLPELKLKNINKLKLDKNLLKVVKTKSQFSDRNIPLTMNLNYYGNKLNYTLNINGYIDSIIYNGINIFDNVAKYNKPGMIGRENILFSKINCKSNIKIFMYSKGYTPRYKDFGGKVIRNYMLIVDDTVINHRLIEVYNIQDIKKISGTPIFFCQDIPLNESKLEFIRMINGFTLHIAGEKIIKYGKKIILPPIKYKNISQDKQVRNSNIGVFDIETYYDHKKDKSFSYALGFKIFKGETSLFYKKPNQSSTDLILEGINSMLVHSYNKYTFYVHNLNGFDSVFILSALLEYNSKRPDYYKINTIFRDNRIIKLEVGIKPDKGHSKKITFVDSYLMLTDSLEKLAKDFDCDNTKGVFPYDFVDESNLYYKGGNPAKSYYKNLTDFEYNLICKDS